MVRTRNPKNPEQKYFDFHEISYVDDEDESAFEEFIHNYASYVVTRVKLFSSKFDELKKIDSTSKEKKVIKLIQQIDKLLNLG